MKSKLSHLVVALLIALFWITAGTPGQVLATVAPPSAIGPLTGHTIASHDQEEEEECEDADAEAEGCEDEEAEEDD